ncbi:MAG: DNA polymerase [Patescibacteria group bacterium]
MKQESRIKKSKKLVLLDAHAIIHRAYHALPDFATSQGEPTGALYGLVAMLIKILSDLKPDYIVGCFDLPEPTHRHEAYGAYKAGRAKTDENLAIQLERAKDVFSAFSIPIYSSPGFEADDILGTIVKEIKGRTFKNTQGSTLGNIEIIIASGDMDTLQLVEGDKVKIFTLKKGLNDTILYNEKKVEERFGFKPVLLVDFKGLRGDPSDNIVGVKGIGEKTATSLVISFGTVEKIYKALKKDKEEVKKRAGITERIANLLLENEEEALFSKTLTTIRDDAPINFSLPKPWRETLILENVLELFQKLEFRTLGERVRRLLAPAEASSMEAELPQHEEARLPKGDLLKNKELCLALWVIDSNITNPEVEDVFRFTKTHDSKEAEKIIENELNKRKVTNVFEEIEKPLLPVVEAMNKRGIKIDRKLLEKLSKEYHEKLSELEKQIWKEAGEEFNINSPKALSEILFNKMELGEKRQKKTPGGAISTKESELTKLEHKHPIIRKILDYRELQKLLSTYIDTIPKQLDKNSRLHSTFLQAGTTTGRLASANPNLQNIPVKTELGRAIRHAFIAEKGFKLVSLDYSQIELRIAAILSKDPKFIEIFKKGEDVHAGVAARVFGVKPEEVSKAMRIKAKTINFGILYGMGVNALKMNLKTDRQEAQEFYNNYFKTFSRLASYLDGVKAETARKGYTETMFGRRRYFSGFKSPLPYVRAQAERMAINAPIQGTQADIIKIAMKKIDGHIHKEKNEENMRLLLQVHDELVFEVKENLVEEAVTHLKNIMETVMPEDKTHGVPILVDARVGNNWGEME